MSNTDQAPTPEDEYSFSKFANLPFYRDINARLIDLSEVAQQPTIIDLCCGTGGITKLILDRLHSAREGLGDKVSAARGGLQDRVQAARETVIYAVDHSGTALRAAMADLGNRKEAAVRFVQAEVQQLQTAVRGQVDAIIYCNSIHYVPDKAGLLAQLRMKLRPGGILAINTSFFDGSHPPESLEFYRRWMMRSLRILKREYGLSPDRSQKVEARKQLTADDYEALLNSNGFRVVQKDVTAFDVPMDGYHYISAFSDWIHGVMPGVPLDRGRAALQQGLQEVFAEMKLNTVPRAWLSLSAVRAA